MTRPLNDLSPAALKAAMEGGTEGWGQWGSIQHHQRYVEPMPHPLPKRGWRRCVCGCKRRSTHRGMANGVCLASGCELSMRRWVIDPIRARSRTP